ncbi:hypothetical protein U1Q18_045851 [Sarracenia purpurea var. burkii]
MGSSIGGHLVEIDPRAIDNGTRPLMPSWELSSLPYPSTISKPHIKTSISNVMQSPTAAEYYHRADCRGRPVDRHNAKFHIKHNTKQKQSRYDNHYCSSAVANAKEERLLRQREQFITQFVSSALNEE